MGSITERSISYPEFKSLNGLLEENYHFLYWVFSPHLPARHASDLRIDRSHCSKAQLRSSFFFVQRIERDSSQSKEQ